MPDLAVKPFAELDLNVKEIPSALERLVAYQKEQELRRQQQVVHEIELEKAKGV